MELMKTHANAALAIRQREEVKRLHLEEDVSYRGLASRFGVNLSTIRRWVKRDFPLDLSTAPKKRRSALNPIQREAVLQYRRENPKAGGKTIAAVLEKEHGPMSHATISRLLKANGFTQAPIKKIRKCEPLQVGRHRLQMDIQQLPAIRGEKGFEYKISIIHMATRMKYSEIHPQVTSETVAQAVRNALGHMPPFFFSLDG